MISNLSDAELIEIGKKAVERERGKYIDNCYRAGLIPSCWHSNLSLQELRKLWTEYVSKY